MRYPNRFQAGQVLAGGLAAFRDLPDVLVLALPRGGVPVGFEVAVVLHASLDVFVVRKLGLPGQPELAMGAIASGGIRVLNPEVVNYLNVPPSVVDAVAAQELRELERREREYRGDAPPPSMNSRRIILVDDGLATGSTMRAAAAAVRQRNPAAVIVAVPVAPPSTCDALKADASVDDVVCPLRPAQFSAVGQWYEDFTQTTDDEVRDLLARARDAASRREPASPREAD